MGALVGQLGIGGLLSLAVWLILSGRLVPRSTVDDIRQQRDRWEQAARASESARAEDRQQVRELLEVARVTERVLTALPSTPAGEVSHGPAPVDEAAAS